MKRTVVLSKRTIDKQDFDCEDDLKDFVCNKLGVEDYKELKSEWSFDDKYYVMIVEVKNKSK